MPIFVSSNSKMPQKRKAANQRMLERLGGKAEKKYIGEEGCEKSVYKAVEIIIFKNKIGKFM